MLVALVLAIALLGRVAWGVSEWRQAAAPAEVALAAKAATATANTVDLAAVQRLGLFGGASAGSNSGDRPAAATTDLALSLEGVVVGSDPADSVAVIVSNGQQQTYHIGDPLPVGVAVTVARIEKDHVILSNNGIDQTLWLYEEGKAPRVATVVRSGRAATAERPSAAAGAKELEPGAKTAEQQIKQASARLAEIIEVSPAVSNGQLIGYSLAPGFRLKDFVQLGFKTNDVITAVNGIALNDMGNLPELYRLMNETGDVSFSLLRDGEPLTLQMTMAP